MRRMSFDLTTEQVLARTKTVTRRLASTWRDLKFGDRIVAVDKAMGLKRGQSPRVLAVLRVVSVITMPLGHIDADDCAREGFPDKTPAEFVEMLAAYYKMTVDAAREMVVRRIEFEYLEGAALVAALGEIDARRKSARKARERRELAGWRDEVARKAGGA